MKNNHDKRAFPVVLQVLPEMNQGGVEHVTLTMARAIGKTFGENTSFIASHGGSLLEETKDQENPFVHIKFPLHSKNPITLLLNAYRLFVLIKRHRINVMHARSRAPAWSALLAAKIAKIPLITTVHGAHKVKYASSILSFFKRLYNSSMVRGDVVIAISPFIESYIHAHYPNVKPLLIQAGIDATFYRRRQPHDALSYDTQRDPILFLPSRLSPIKGIEVALLALRTLIPQHPSLTLWLMNTGKKSYRETLDKVIEDYGLKKHVTFLEPTSDLRYYYENADIVLMTSLVPEALGRTSIEALSMECILIASDNGATSSICRHNETGFLVKPGDADELARSIQKVLSMQKSEKEVFHKRGRLWVEEHFNKRIMVDETLTLYRMWSTKG